MPLVHRTLAAAGVRLRRRRPGRRRSRTGTVHRAARRHRHGPGPGPRPRRRPARRLQPRRHRPGPRPLGRRPGERVRRGHRRAAQGGLLGALRRRRHAGSEGRRSAAPTPSRGCPPSDPGADLYADRLDAVRRTAHARRRAPRRVRPRPAVGRHRAPLPPPSRRGRARQAQVGAAAPRPARTSADEHRSSPSPASLRFSLLPARLDDLPAILRLEAEGFGPEERWSERSWSGELLGAGPDGPDRPRRPARRRGRALDRGRGGRPAPRGRRARRTGARASALRLVRAGLLAVRHLGARAGDARGRVRPTSAAIALYQRLGFEQLRVRRDYYGPGQDALILQLYDLETWPGRFAEAVRTPRPTCGPNAPTMPLHATPTWPEEAS